MNTGVLIFLQRPIHRVAYMCQCLCSLQVFYDKPEQLYLVQNWIIIYWPLEKYWLTSKLNTL